MMSTHFQHIRRRASRGMALMLVMIALIVGSVLTTGYLLSQNTAIGLTQNQASSDMARQLASTGIDCALYYLKKNDGWDISNYNLNWRVICDQSSANRVLIDNDIFTGAHVRVEIKPVSPAVTFSADARTAVDIVSTGTYDGQKVTITSRTQPTGGGTPWSQGVFALGNMTIQGPTATLDSYKSNNSGPSIYINGNNNYNTLLWQLLYRSSADVISMSGITVDGNVQYWGSALTYTNASNITTKNGGGCIPRPASEMPLKRIPGWVTPPNITQFSNLSTISTSTASYTVTNGVYPSDFSLDATSTPPEGDPGNTIGRCLVLRGNGVICVTGDMKINANTTLRVRRPNTTTNSNVVFYVKGNVTVQGRIVIDDGCTMKIFAANQVLMQRYARVNTDVMNDTGKTLSGKSAVVGPSAMQIFGLPSCTKVRMEDHAWASALIFAPQSLVELTCDSSLTFNDAVQFYGAVVGNDISIKGASKLHQDLDSVSTTSGNITGGTYSGEYEVRQSW